MTGRTDERRRTLAAQAGGDGLCGLREVVAQLRELGGYFTDASFERATATVAADLLERLAASPRTIASDGLRMPPNPSAGEVNAEMLEALKAVHEPYRTLTADALEAGILMEFGPPKPDRGAAQLLVRAVISRAEASAPEDGRKS